MRAAEAEAGFGVGVGLAVEIGCEAVTPDETVDEAVFEVEPVLEDEAVSELGSAAGFVFGAGKVIPPAVWAFVEVLTVLEGSGAVQALLV